MSTAHDLSRVSDERAVHLAVVPDLVDDQAADAIGTASAAGTVAWADADFEAVLRKATPRLVRFAQRRLGNVHEAEEVSQEALLRTYQHRNTLATEDDVMAWATFASNRLVIDRLRVRGRSISVADVPEGRRVARDTAEIAEARAEARLALDALDALPARQAAVLWAREVEGSSYEEISTRFGLSEPTVRSLLHRARKALRREYAARGGTLPLSGVAILGPWLNPLHHAKRLRSVASALVGTTALGVLSFGVFSLSSPNRSDIAPAPDTTTEATAPVAQRTIQDADVRRVRPSAPIQTPTVSSTQLTPQNLPTLPSACAPGAVGVNCSTPQTPKNIWVGVPRLARIYVGSFDVGCNMIGAVPATTGADPGVVGCDSRPSP